MKKKAGDNMEGGSHGTNDGKDNQKQTKKK